VKYGSLDLGVVRFVEWPHVTAPALCKLLFSPCWDPIPLDHIPRQGMCLVPMVVWLPTNILQFLSSMLLLIFAEMDPQGLSTLFKPLTQIMVSLPSEGNGKLLLSLS